jgi:hypothetical protein
MCGAEKCLIGTSVDDSTDEVIFFKKTYHPRTVAISQQAPTGGHAVLRGGPSLRRASTSGAVGSAFILISFFAATSPARAACMPGGPCIPMQPYVAHGMPHGLGGGYSGIAAGIAGWAIGEALSAAIASQQRSGPSMHDRSVNLNNEGVRLGEAAVQANQAGNYRRAIDLGRAAINRLQQSLKVEPGDQQVVKNLAKARANLRISENNLALTRRTKQQYQAEQQVAQRPPEQTEKAGQQQGDCKSRGSTAFFGTGGSPAGENLDCSANKSTDAQVKQPQTESRIEQPAREVQALHDTPRPVVSSTTQQPLRPGDRIALNRGEWKSFSVADMPPPAPTAASPPPNPSTPSPQQSYSSPCRSIAGTAFFNTPSNPANADLDCSQLDKLVLPHSTFVSYPAPTAQVKAENKTIVPTNSQKTEAIGRDTCSSGGFLVCGKENHQYCMSSDSSDIYERLSAHYKFSNSAEYSPAEKCQPLSRSERKNLIILMCTLKYMELNDLPPLKDNKPSLTIEDEKIFTAWWSYREGALDRYAPWGYVNCEGKKIVPKENETDPKKLKGLSMAVSNCDAPFASGKVQVGYGIDLRDSIHGDEKLGSLRAAFKKFYGNQPNKVQEVGNAVLDTMGERLPKSPHAAELADLRFPAWSDEAWHTLEGKRNMVGPRSHLWKPAPQRTNHFWASILLRDPKISAYMALRDARTFPCFIESPAPDWCDSYPKMAESQKLLTIIREWKLLEKNLHCEGVVATK